MLKNKIILFSVMIQTTNLKTEYAGSIIGLIVFLLFSACSSDPFEKTESPGNGGNPIRIGAFMSEYLHSRAEGDMEETEGDMEVKDGEYCLSYPIAGSGAYRNAVVSFGVTGFEASIGVVITESGSELTWDNVGNGSQPTFYLDNIPKDKSSGGDPTSVSFNDQYNPFVAGLYDSESFTNDLLWGSKTEFRNSKTINFDLHHNMARLKVEVTVDKTNETEEGDLNLSEAEVVITSLVKSPVSYNRLDGTLKLSEERETLTLVDTELHWESSVPDSENENIFVYTTKDFVLPPQGLPEDNTRPVLEIRLKNGTIYSGILPYAMEVVDNEHLEPYPMTLYFLKEHILTIRTLVTEEPPQLEFMPVQVVEWVYKGEFSFDGHQAGIYTANEFYSFIKAYNEGNEARLDRYGQLVKPENSETGIWIIQFWNSVVLDYNKIYNQVQNPNPKIPFNFSFNGFTVSVLKDGTSNPVDAYKLYEILTGATTL